MPKLEDIIILYIIEKLEAGYKLETTKEEIIDFFKFINIDIKDINLLELFANKWKKKTHLKIKGNLILPNYKLSISDNVNDEKLSFLIKKYLQNKEKRQYQEIYTKNELTLSSLAFNIIIELLPKNIEIESVKNLIIKRIAYLLHEDNNLKISNIKSSYLKKANFDFIMQENEYLANLITTEFEIDMQDGTYTIHEKPLGYTKRL